jgi:hypothetical protein
VVVGGSGEGKLLAGWVEKVCVHSLVGPSCLLPLHCVQSCCAGGWGNMYAEATKRNHMDGGDDHARDFPQCILLNPLLIYVYNQTKALVARAGYHMVIIANIGPI